VASIQTAIFAEVIGILPEDLETTWQRMREAFGELDSVTSNRI
jgi:hypothetical protein